MRHNQAANGACPWKVLSDRYARTRTSCDRSSASGPLATEDAMRQTRLLWRSHSSTKASASPATARPTRSTSGRDSPKLSPPLRRTRGPIKSVSFFSRSTKSFFAAGAVLLRDVDAVDVRDVGLGTRRLAGL